MNKIPKEREELANKIIEILSYENFPHFPLFVYGNLSTGKSLTIKSILSSAEELGLGPHVYVNAVLALGQSSYLLAQILSQLLPVTCRKSDDYSSFLKKIKNWVEEEEAYERSKPLILVIDAAEKLLKMDCNIVPFLLKLNEETNGKIRLVLITNVVFDLCFLEAVTAFFPAYTQKELASIVIREFSPSSVSAETRKILSDDALKQLFQNFVTIVLSCISDVTNDVLDVKRVVSKSFSLYLKPILENGVKWDNTKRLSKCFLNNQDMLCEILSQENNLDKKGLINDNLTEVQKYLLASSFVASYNEAKFDLRNFTNATGPKTKFKRAGKISSKNSKGPSAFTAERALAIYRHFSLEDIAHSIDVYKQFVSLLVSGYLSRQTGIVDLNFSTDGKFKCNIGLDEMRLIAKSIKVDLDDFLH